MDEGQYCLSSISLIDELPATQVIHLVSQAGLVMAVERIPYDPDYKQIYGFLSSISWAAFQDGT